MLFATCQATSGFLLIDAYYTRTTYYHRGCIHAFDGLLCQLSSYIASDSRRVKLTSVLSILSGPAFPLGSSILDPYPCLLMPLLNGRLQVYHEMQLQCMLLHLISLQSPYLLLGQYHDISCEQYLRVQGKFPYKF